jgi:nicotinamidase-related amidase
MTATTALLVIDVQKAFEEDRDAGYPWANPDAPAAIASLIAAFRAQGLPVLHVHHHGTDPDDNFHPAAPGAQPMDCAQPRADEALFVKTGSSAFIGTGLSAHLDALGQPALVIVGGAANYCVDTTTRMAGNLGHRVTVVEDALINFQKTLRDGRVMPAGDVLALTLANLSDEFARIAPATVVLSEIAP